MKKRLSKNQKRGFFTLRKNNSAVSETLGTILLLSISIVLFSLLFVIVNQVSQEYARQPVPMSTLIGNVIGDEVVLRHLGGEALPPGTKIILTIAGTQYSYVLGGEIVSGFELPGDSQWDIGEDVTYEYITGSLLNLEVKGLVVDMRSNSVIMDILIQAGEKGDRPYVQTLGNPPTGVDFANLSLYYNFINAGDFSDVKIEMQCEKEGDTFEAINWGTILPLSSAPIDGYNWTIFTHLQPNTKYFYRASIQYVYNGDTYQRNGSKLSFTTNSEIVGHWKFDEGSGNIAYDSSGQGNHGTLYPIGKGPQRVDGDEHASDPLDHALSFDGIDDQVRVNDSNSLDLTNQLQINLSVKPSDFAESNISQIETNILNGLSQFGPQYYDCYKPDIINVSTDGSDHIYGIVSRNQNSSPQGYLITVKINDDGFIESDNNNCFIDYFTFETTQCYMPKIIKVEDSADYFAIVYSGNDSRGKVITVQINDQGIITPAVRSWLQFDNPGETPCAHPDIIHVYDSYYAVVYSANSTGGSYYTNNYGRMATFSINPNGSIGSRIDFTQFHDNAFTIEPEIIKLKENGNEYLYAIAFNSDDDDGGLCTISINTLNGKILDVSEVIYFDSMAGKSPEIIKVSEPAGNPIVAFVYGGASAGCNSSNCPVVGTIRTWNYTSSTRIWNFNKEVIFEPKENCFFEPDVIKTGSSGGYAYYAIVYRGPGPSSSNTNLSAKTIGIHETTGRITSIIDSTVFQYRFNSNSIGYTPQIIAIPNPAHNMYAVVYRQGCKDGVLKTLQISSTGGIPDDYPILDSHELGIFQVTDAKIFKVTDNGDYGIYALFYSGENYDGYIKTIKIYEDGSINNTILASYTIARGIYTYLSNPSETDYFYAPDYTYITQSTTSQMLKGGGDKGAKASIYSIYAVIYYGDSALRIKTVSIYEDGSIVPKGDYSFGSSGFYLSSGSIGPGTSQNGHVVYPIVYCQPQAHIGSIRLVTINGDGVITNISNPPVDVIFETITNIAFPSIIKINGTNIYACLYTNGSKMTLRTFTITITDTVSLEDVYLLDTSASPSSSSATLQVGTKTNPAQAFIAAVYRTSSGPGLIKTLAINTSDGTAKANITPVIDSLPFESSSMMNPEIINIDSRIYAIVYRGSSANNGGFIKTLRIAADTGNITDNVDTTSEIDPSSPFDIECKSPSIVQVSDYMYAIFYGGYYYSDAYIKTLNITPTPSLTPLCIKAGAYSLRGSFSEDFPIFNATIWQINGNQVNCSGTPTSTPPDGFYHINITFNASTATLTLTVDQTVLSTATGTPGFYIVTNSNQLIFGSYNAVIDDIIIRSRIL